MNSSRQGKVCIFHKVMQECQTVFLLSNFNFVSKFSMEQVTNLCWAHKTVQLITQSRVKTSSWSHLDASTISGYPLMQDILKRQHGFTELWYRLLPPEHVLFCGENCLFVSRLLENTTQPCSSNLVCSQGSISLPELLQMQGGPWLCAGGTYIHVEMPLASGKTT